MVSPKKSGRKLGLVLSRLTLEKGGLTTNTKAKEPLYQQERSKNEYCALQNFGALHRKSIPKMQDKKSSVNDSTDSVDNIFNSSNDISSHLNTNISASPIQTTNLPDLLPLREQLSQNKNDMPVLQLLNVNDDENLPATQPATACILSSVVAYVEVRSGGDNRTRLVMRELRNLGATVSERLMKDVTHVVFKDGKLSTYKWAVRKQVHMVSTLWIDRCQKAKKMVPECLFPPYLEYYKNPDNHKKIKRVRSFQPDYDMDQEQRMKRIRKRMKPRPVPVVTHKYVPLAEEKEIEYDFMRRLVHTKLVRNQSPGECSLARGLRTIAGPIDPHYNEYIQRAVSPTSSEDDMNPVPLAVKLMRRIQSPAPNSRIFSKNYQLQDKSPQNAATEDEIETTLANLFGESSDTDSSDIIPVNTSAQPTMPAVTPQCFPSNSVSSGKNGDEPPAKLRKTEAMKHPALETTEIATENIPSTPGPTASQRAVRKLFNAPRLDDSPVLIVPSSSDTEASQSMSKSTKSTRKKKLKQKQDVSNTVDMELTACVGNAILEDPTMQRQNQEVSSTVDMEMTPCVGKVFLDDPSSLKTKNLRKSLRIKGRRSSDFFTSPKQSVKKDAAVETPVENNTLPTIVCTSLNHEEVNVIKLIAKQLGGFELEDTVTRKTTHVVSMNKCSRRTVNILRGIARGCWIVKKMWALKSLEAGRWIPEAEFEWTEFSPAVQLCRHERMAFSPYYRADFFQECGTIFVSNKTKPPRKELCELICLCGGKVTFTESAAKIIVGESGDSESVAYVTATWVLDTIQFATLKPVADYAIDA